MHMNVLTKGWSPDTKPKLEQQQTSNNLIAPDNFDGTVLISKN